MHISKLVEDIAEVESFDESDLLLGYAAGFDGMPAKAYWSKSFLHGWRNGLIDAGYSEPDTAETSPSTVPRPRA